MRRMQLAGDARAPAHIHSCRCNNATAAAAQLVTVGASNEDLEWHFAFTSFRPSQCKHAHQSRANNRTPKTVKSVLYTTMLAQACSFTRSQACTRDESISAPSVCAALGPAPWADAADGCPDSASACAALSDCAGCCCNGGCWGCCCCVTVVVATPLNMEGL